MEKINLIEYWMLENETILEIGKFSILWGCFEWKYFDNNCNKNKIDNYAKKINNENAELLVLCYNIINKLRSLYNHDSNTIIERLHSGIMSSEIEKCLKTDCSDKLSIIQGTLYICYRVRNNMFHGEKCEFFLNEQKDLFKKINFLLNQLLTQSS